MSNTDGATYPAPEVPARPALPGEVKGTAAGLLKAAQEGGWWHSARYARGTLPTGDAADSPDLRWAPGPVVDSIVIRARRGVTRVVACFIDGKFSTAWALPGPDGIPIKLGARQVAAILKTKVTL